MRHASIEFARRANDLHESGERFDAVFATDMMNLAEFRGLASPAIGRLPTALYFHESQLTYPSRVDGAERSRDLHFAFSNAISAHASDDVWFNSEYHRRIFLRSLGALLRRMPDRQPRDLVGSIEAKSRVLYPPVEDPGHAMPSIDGPLRVAWVSRWEHDKDPELFFDALRRLAARGVDFRVRVMGERFGKAPPCFEEAKQGLGNRIEQWGYIDSRQAYHQALRGSDAVVSTAHHEFFGIAIVEAALAGCAVIAPDGLAYPEVLGGRGLLYSRRDPEDIADALEGFAQLRRLGDSNALRELGSRDAVERYLPGFSVKAMDDAVESLTKT